MHGAGYSGVTFHMIDAGIDTGDIIDQERIEINAKDTCRDLYFKYIEYGTRLVIRNLESVICNKVITRRQKTDNASYYSRKAIDYNNLSVDFNAVAVYVERQIRAFSFREYQMPKYNGVDIIDCLITNIKSCSRPGEILLEDESSMMVSTIDYNVVLYKDRFSELITACITGEYDRMKSICSVVKHINEVDFEGRSPLIHATIHNQKEIAKYLIMNGANIYIKDNNLKDLLLYAKDAYKEHGDRELFDLYKRLGL